MNDFADFWAAYPRKVGKLAAKREWDRLRPSPETVQQMAAALIWQCEAWNDPKYVPHPATWLHQGRWMDEQPAPMTPKKEIPKHLDGIAQWMKSRAANE